MILLARVITRNFSNPTNNRLRTSSNTRNQAIVQGDKVNIQSKNSGNDGRNTRRSYVQEEVIESNTVQNDAGNIQRTLRTASSGTVANVQCYNCSEKGHYARNCLKPRIKYSKYFMEHILLAKQDEAGVILTDEQNNFLFVDASRMEEIKELSANIFLMAKFNQQTLILMLGQAIILHFSVRHAYADVHAQNQDLLLTISELKSMTERSSSVRRPSNRDSSFKNSVISNTKNSSKKVEVYDRTNKKSDVASKNVGLDTFVTNDEIKNALIAENILCVSSAKNVVQIVLWIVDSGCSKHMTGDRSLLKISLRNSWEPSALGTIILQQSHDMAEAVSTAFFTQNQSIIHTRNNKNPYKLLRGRKPNVEYFHVFGSLCYLTNDPDDLRKMKPKSDIGIFIGYSETSRGFRIYNRHTKKIIETIHVKFDELTAMDFEHDNLEPVSQRFINDDSSVESMNTPSKEDLDNFFGPMYDEYFEKKSSDMPINFAAQQVHNQEDSYLTSSIDIEAHEAPPIITTSKEQNSPISLTVADDFYQEDSAELDGNTLLTSYDASDFSEAESSTNLDPSNMHEFHQVQSLKHIWTKAHSLEQIIGDSSKPVMTRHRLQTDP
nr:retrovirus-related Pol polyprotein from transposon TNT 1-94 [Tanacetum cinerariifolium]